MDIMTRPDLAAHWQSILSPLFPRADVGSEIVGGACIIRWHWQTDAGEARATTLNIQLEALDGYLDADRETRQSRDSRLHDEVSCYIRSSRCYPGDELLIRGDFLDNF